jgi:hypothetical protein
MVVEGMREVAKRGKATVILHLKVQKLGQVCSAERGHGMGRRMTGTGRDIVEGGYIGVGRNKRRLASTEQAHSSCKAGRGLPPMPPKSQTLEGENRRKYACR